MALCAGIFCAWCCVLLMAGEYNSARLKLSIYEHEMQEWEACRQTKPSYFRENSEAVSSCLKGFNEARDNPWLNLPKNQLVGFFVLAALASAFSGSLAVWIVVWIVVLSISRFVRLLKFCILRKPCRQM